MKIALSFALLLSSFVWGLTVPPEWVNEQLAKADFVGNIYIEKTEPWDQVVGVAPKSLATAKTEQGDTIQISYYGGEKLDRGYFFSGIPRPYVGHHYLAYLKKGANNIYEVAGFEFGLKDLSPKRGYSRNRTDGSNGDGGGPFLYWDAKYFPIPYFISEPTFRGRSELVTEIDQSFGTWRNVETTRVEFVAMGCSSAKYNENDGLNSIILVTQNWPFDSAAIAITRNFYVAGNSEYSGLILDSDILLNAVNHQFTVGSENGKHDLRNILTHEIGHFLGLGHEVTPVNTDSTMYAVASTAELKKQSLSVNDISGLEEAYLGVGQKLSNHNTLCEVAEANAGCRLGVSPSRTAPPYSFILSILFVLLQIPLARIFLNKN